MSKFIGKGAVIKNPEAMTHGKPCVVDSYNHEIRKYEVSFDGGWCGWYTLKELKFDDENAS